MIKDHSAREGGIRSCGHPGSLELGDVSDPSQTKSKAPSVIEVNHTKKTHRFSGVVMKAFKAGLLVAQSDRQVTSQCKKLDLGREPERQPFALIASCHSAMEANCRSDITCISMAMVRLRIGIKTARLQATTPLSRALPSG